MQACIPTDALRVRACLSLFCWRTQAVDPNLATLADEAAKTPFEEEGSRAQGKKAAKAQKKQRAEADADASGGGGDGRSEATGSKPLAMDIRSMCVLAIACFSSSCFPLSLRGRRCTLFVGRFLPIPQPFFHKIIP